jgi:SAM-dependent methyltransferase
LFNPRLLAGIKKAIPQPLTDRLDPFEAAIQKFVRATAKSTRVGERVLDAGAGECRFKPMFGHARYVGLDFGLGDPNWDYSKLDAVGRLEDLPFPSSSFDRVLSIVVLEHTPEPGQVIQEFARVLAPGGTAHLVVPHMWEEHQKPHDYFRFTSSGMRYLMERAGLKVQRIEPVGGFFWMLSRRLMNVLSFTQKGWKWILFPFLAPVFGLIVPLCCYYLDYLDSYRAYTLGFVCEGSKPDSK